jgi:hypothetical protein
MRIRLSQGRVKLPTPFSSSFLPRDGRRRGPQGPFLNRAANDNLMEILTHLNQERRPILVLATPDPETARDAGRRVLPRSRKVAAAARSSPPRLKTPAADR